MGSRTFAREREQEGLSNRRTAWCAMLRSAGWALAVLILASLGACATPSSAPRALDPAVPSWRLAYQHDAQGRALSGSKEALLKAIRRGDPVRVAWGLETDDGKISVEHTADPVFLTIMNGDHVVIQLPEHIAQSSYWDVAAVQFENPAVMWRGMMGTDGRFDAVWLNRASGEVVRRVPQRVRLAWLTFSPAPEADTRVPLDLAVRDGVVRSEPATPAR
jgi:hypothetical protein